MGVLNASKYYFNINTVNTCRRFFSNQQLDAIKLLNPKVQTYLQEKVKICQPDRVHVCDGSETEYKSLVDSMIKQGQLVKLAKYENWLVFSWFFCCVFLLKPFIYKLAFQYFKIRIF